MKSKFKVGDRVRVTTSKGGGKAGDIATITGFGSICDIDGRYCFLSGLSNGYEGLYESRLELVDAKKFKVGDKVRATADTPRGEIGRIVEDDGIEPRYRVKFDGWTGGHGNGGRDWWLRSEHLAPAAEENSFTIVAGRYYKTRDGRKALVGDNVGGDMFPFYHAVEGRLWHGITAGGKSCVDSDKDDLVAEWTNEPTKPIANVAAQADTIADEYGAGGKPKFKVGDKIVAAKSFAGAAKPGDMATVASRGEYWCDICKTTLVDDMWDRHPHAHGQNDGGYYLNDFELAAAPSPAIVAVIEKCQPLPATRPYVHADRTAAETEAKRLAGIHKGKEFGVYEYVSSVKFAEKFEKTYEHEWQRLAAGGERITAICKLRDAAGLHYDTAKVAVDSWLMQAA